MYTLVKAKLASMYELKEVYTLDEALKLYSLYVMDTDIERCRNEDLEAKQRSEQRRNKR